MTTATTGKNALFKRRVIGLFQGRGIPAQPGPQFREGAPDSTVAGVPGVAISVSTRTTLDLATRLREAQEASGTDRAAIAVLQRAGHGTADSYAVMRLADLVELVAQAHPEAVRTVPQMFSTLNNTRDCRECHEPFTPYDSRQSWCGRNCRERYRRRERSEQAV